MRLTINLARRRLVVVVLAAGGSSRLGRPKQLLRRRSIPLILRSVRLAKASVGGRVIVVLGHEQQRLRSLLRRHANALVVVNNPGWREGLASSLRASLSATPPTASAVLYLLADQVQVDAANLRHLVNAWTKRPSRPAAARYLGRGGVPAIIPRRWFGRIASLTGDVGARRLLRDFDEVTYVDMPSAQFDIDTATDAAKLGY